MTKEKAIKYLQQLYPNGGHCWLDEQRIEAIGIAVKALQEEHVSEIILEGANFNKSWYAHPELAFKAGAKRKKQMMMKDATDVIVHVDAGGYPYIQQIELYNYDKDVPLAKEGDRVKVVVIKED